MNAVQLIVLILAVGLALTIATGRVDLVTVVVGGLVQIASFALK